MPGTATINPIQSSNILPTPQQFVQVKEHWDDEEWIQVPYLYATSWKRCSAPEIPTAVFRFDVGYIKYPRETPRVFQPQDIRGWFIRILVQAPQARPQVVWTGRIVEESLDATRYDLVSGNEFFVARGIADVLADTMLTQSWSEQNVEDGDPFLGLIDDVLVFNERPRRGASKLKGNRTTNDTDGIHYFSSDGELWSAEDVLNYLIFEFTDDQYSFRLEGQKQPLSELHDVWDFRGLNLWQCLCRLIDRKSGLCFEMFPSTDEDGDIIIIDVRTLTDSTVQVGDVTLPKNNRPTTLYLPTEAPYTHLPSNIPFRTVIDNEYSEIVVWGDLIRLVCNCDFGDQAPLEKGWKQELEDEYRDAFDPEQTDQDDEDVNDANRAQTKFTDVFRRLVVKPTWDGTQGEDPTNILPIVYPDGSVSTTVDPEDEESAPIIIQWTKRFERFLPFKRGVDYSVSPPEDHNPDDTEAEYVPLAIYYNDDEDGENHTKDDRWHHLEELRRTSEDLEDMDYGPLDNAFGVRLSASPNHYLALNHWEDAGETRKMPELDYEKLLVVGCFKTDSRQTIIMKSKVDNGRRLTVEVPSARYTYAAPGTCVGINADGEKMEIHPDNEILEDDLELLQAVASRVSAWFGKKRQAVEIPIKQIGFVVPLGSMLTDITFMKRREPINTVITSVECDWDNQRTIVRTSYAELDFVSGIGSSGDVTEGELI